MLFNSKQILPFLSLITCLIPLPAIANTVEIYDYISRSNKITLKVKVNDENNFPIEGLQANNFTLATQDNQGNTVTLNSNQFYFESPVQTKPDTAYIAILLDMSGSMKHKDSRGYQKLAGATTAIKEFITSAKKENLDIKISLIPFGYAGNTACNYLYEVNQDNIGTNYPFLELNHPKLDEKLKEYQNVDVCAATDLHQPLLAASKHLRAKFQQHSQNFSNSQKISPRLVTILLSDGFDNRTKQETGQLKEILQQSPKINVHTLGYGESLKNLRDRAICDEYIPNDELTPQTVIENCRLPKSQGNIAEFVIDEQKLTDIAHSTGSTYQISNNAETVAKSLIQVLKTLREYRITYEQPGAERGGTYTPTVKVNNTSLGVNNISPIKKLSSILLSIIHYL